MQEPSGLHALIQIKATVNVSGKPEGQGSSIRTVGSHLRLEDVRGICTALMDGEPSSDARSGLELGRLVSRLRRLSRLSKYFTKAGRSVWLFE